MCAPVNLHEYIPLEKELGQMGKSVGADGWGAQCVKALPSLYFCNTLAGTAWRTS